MSSRLLAVTTRHCIAQSGLHAPEKLGLGLISVHSSLRLNGPTSPPCHRIWPARPPVRASDWVEPCPSVPGGQLVSLQSEAPRVICRFTARHPFLS